MKPGLVYAFIAMVAGSSLNVGMIVGRSGEREKFEVHATELCAVDCKPNRARVEYQTGPVASGSEQAWFKCTCEVAPPAERK